MRKRDLSNPADFAEIAREMSSKFMIVGYVMEAGVDCIGVSKSQTAAGWPYEIVGPSPDDGGPYLYCACKELQIAQQIKAALELALKLST